MSKKKINVAVIGATGFTGLDLTFLLSKHPNVNIINLCATKNLGKKIHFFDQRIKKKLLKITSINKINWKKLDLVFLSLPNGEAQKIIKKVYHEYKNLKFIDLSADFRIHNPKDYFKWYNKKHFSINNIKNSIYSISEFIKKDIKKYKIISCPGCYPTSIQLPLIPLLRQKLIKYDNITIDSKSGYSGAGKSYLKRFTHKNFYNSIYAYSTFQHRHMSELDQEFLKVTNKKVEYSFNPHLLPTFRGLLSSIYLELRQGITVNKILNTLNKEHKNNSFVKVLKLNQEIGTGNVLNTNNCEISVCKTNQPNKIVIFSAIDNLIKGASGQAVQNMNLLYGLNEGIGLK